MNEATETAAHSARPWLKGFGLLLIAALILGVGVLVAQVGGFLFGGYPKPKPQGPFNQHVWLVSGGGSWERYDDRGRMIDSVLRDHVRLGMPRSAVESLLGQPDSPSWSDLFPTPATSSRPETASPTPTPPLCFSFMTSRTRWRVG